ncbi:14189_t:CDS:2 [Gigaspora margarita]|uniref:14189_t:CDS:1 n=1 Tax=Gigaspora margarita TaxID=4874 RepID=A0ABN7VDB4_GIGMA|nr:14189_t:CDS:2 [Gigaspora margarita]
MHRINRINSIKTLKLHLYNAAITQNGIIRLYSNNNLNAFKLIYHIPKIKLDFSKRPQMILKRCLNQDTNVIEKSSETVLEDSNYPKSKKKDFNNGDEKKIRSGLLFRVMEVALTTMIGLAVIGIGGVFYHSWQVVKKLFHKVKLAFKTPDPLIKGISREFLEREEFLETIDKAIGGRAPGKYILLVGERGTGKTKLILNAITKINQYGVVLAEAHSDSEIFKIRLGKALKYTYREDYIGQLFYREAPERGSALLDVEKALNVIETVAIKHYKKRGCPLVLVINHIHAFKDDKEGEDMLELLQQRRVASQMEVIMVRDLKPKEAMNLLKTKRQEPEDELEKIVERVGGRLSYIDKLAKESDIYATVKYLENEERTWIINRIGLIPNFEGSALDKQQYASCAWKLISAIVKSPSHSVTTSEGRIITGNPKWINMMDQDDIIMIDENQNIKANSKILLNIFEEIVNQDGFDELLDNVCERVNEINKGQNTRELIWSKSNNQHIIFEKSKEN